MQQIKTNLRKALFLILGVIIMGCSSSKSSLIKTPPSASVDIIPKPQVLTTSKGRYTVPRSNTISYSGSSKIAAVWLHKLLQSANLNSEIKERSARGNFKLVQDIALQKELGDEGYVLDIYRDKVMIKAAGETGLFYGIQSLRQLLPAGLENGSLTSKRITLPTLHIQDVPKYSWRGNMIDLARSYFGMDYLKLHLDRMALYKMNRLHLHLTDDQ